MREMNMDLGSASRRFIDCVQVKTCRVDGVSKRGYDGRDDEQNTDRSRGQPDSVFVRYLKQKKKRLKSTNKL